jgi:hypothetical protein
MHFRFLRPVLRFLKDDCGPLGLVCGCRANRILPKSKEHPIDDAGRGRVGKDRAGLTERASIFRLTQLSSNDIKSS